MADDWGGGGDDWGGGGGGGGYDDDDGGGSMSDTTHKSWFQRVMESFVGAVIGIVLFLLSFVVLFWNEGRAVNTARALEETDAVVKEIKSDKVDPSMDGKVVHMTGKAVPTEPVKDDAFGIEADAIKLSRNVEMFQWRENKRTEKKKANFGGKETTKTTYTYEKIWSSSPIDSSNFKWNKSLTGGGDPDDEFDDNAGKQPRNNPPWPDQYKSASFFAKQVKLGAFILSEALVKQISGGGSLAVNQQAFDKLPGEIKSQFRLEGGTLYKSAKAGGANPAIGDLRIAFSVVNPTEVSIIAEQTGDTFRAFQPKSSTDKIQMLNVGNRSAKEMVTAAQEGNKILTWILRVVGFLMMAIGFYLVLNPIATLTDFLPFVSSIVGVALGFVSFLVAIVFSAITIAIAWIFYRPLLAFALLGVAAVVFAIVLAMYFKFKKSGGASSNKSKSRPRDDEEDDRPRKRRPDDEDDQPRKRRPDDEDDDRPRRRRD